LCSESLEEVAGHVGVDLVYPDPRLKKTIYTSFHGSEEVGTSGNDLDILVTVWVRLSLRGTRRRRLSIDKFFSVFSPIYLCYSYNKRSKQKVR
jgi:hypothetical protein